MLLFSFARGFERSLKGYSRNDKTEIQRKVDVLMLALDAGQVPEGLGLKKLRVNVWEMRLSLSERVLLLREREHITFLFVGSHDETDRFLRHF